MITFDIDLADDVLSNIEKDSPQELEQKFKNFSNTLFKTNKVLPNKAMQKSLEKELNIIRNRFYKKKLLLLRKLKKKIDNINKSLIIYYREKRDLIRNLINNFTIMMKKNFNKSNAKAKSLEETYSRPFKKKKERGRKTLTDKRFGSTLLLKKTFFKTHKTLFWRKYKEDRKKIEDKYKARLDELNKIKTKFGKKLAKFISTKGATATVTTKHWVNQYNLVSKEIKKLEAKKAAERKKLLEEYENALKDRLVGLESAVNLMDVDQKEAWNANQKVLWDGLYIEAEEDEEYIITEEDRLKYKPIETIVVEKKMKMLMIEEPFEKKKIKRLGKIKFEEEIDELDPWKISLEDLWFRTGFEEEELLWRIPKEEPLEYKEAIKPWYSPGYDVYEFEDYLKEWFGLTKSRYNVLNDARKTELLNEFKRYKEYRRRSEGKSFEEKYEDFLRRLEELDEEYEVHFELTGKEHPKKAELEKIKKIAKTAEKKRKKRKLTPKQRLEKLHKEITRGLEEAETEEHYKKWKAQQEKKRKEKEKKQKRKERDKKIKQWKESDYKKYQSKLQKFIKQYKTILEKMSAASTKSTQQKINEYTDLIALLDDLKVAKEFFEEKIADFLISVGATIRAPGMGGLQEIARALFDPSGTKFTARFVERARELAKKYAKLDLAIRRIREKLQRIIDQDVEAKRKAKKLTTKRLEDVYEACKKK